MALADALLCLATVPVSGRSVVTSPRATPRQQVEAVLETLPLADAFTVDQGERRQLLRYATEHGLCPLVQCLCGKVAILHQVPDIYGAVPVEDRAIQTPDRGVLCGACYAGAESEARHG